VCSSDLLSNFRQLFATSFSYYNYAYDLADTGRYVVQFNQLVAQHAQTLPAGRYTQVWYEDLVGEQERETRRLLEFCDLSWDPRCLRFHENEAPVATASSVQVRSPIHAKSIGRWRRYGEGVKALRDVIDAAGLLGPRN